MVVAVTLVLEPPDRPVVHLPTVGPQGTPVR
jgi:hypothetical protein